MRADRSFEALFSGVRTKVATAEDLITAMDEDKVEFSVALNYSWSTQAFCVETNDYIMESVARYPKRLTGFCSVLPSAGETALRELERCIEGGVKGIGELRLDNISPRSKWLKVIEPVVKMVIEHGLIMLVHTSDPVGHEYPGKGKVTPEMLYALATTFPELKLVCAHWGGGFPFYSLMPEVKAAMKNVYFDTAISPFLYTPHIYGRVAQLVGADKIVFGSDYPMLPPRRLLKEMDSIDLSAETKEKILCGNAKRLLGITDK